MDRAGSGLSRVRYRQTLGRIGRVHLGLLDPVFPHHVGILALVDWASGGNPQLPCGLIRIEADFVWRGTWIRRLIGVRLGGGATRVRRDVEGQSEDSHQ